MTEYFQDLVDYQNKNEYELNKNLELYKEAVAEKDCLQQLCNQHEQWTDKMEYEYMTIFDELIYTNNVQTEKLKMFVSNECEWKIKYKELQNVNDLICDQLNSLNTNENQLKSKLESYKSNINCIQNDLSSIKVNM